MGRERAEPNHPKRREVQVLRLIGILGCVICLISCASPEAQVGEDSSAGPVDTWQIEETPLFSMSAVVVGGDSVFFGDIAPLAEFTPSGGIVLAILSGEGRVIFLDSMGMFDSSFGRTGQGPLEFMRLATLTVNGDTTAVWDPGNQKVVTFVGNVLASEVPLALSPALRVVGMLGDGRMVATPQLNPIDEFWMAYPEHVVTQGADRPYHVLKSTGESVTVVHGAPEPGDPWLPFRRESDGRTAFRYNLSTQCWPRTMDRIVGGGITVADARDGRLIEITPDGVTRLIFRSPHRAAVPEQYLAFLESAIAQSENRVGEFTAASKRVALNRPGRPGEPLATVWSAMVSDIRGETWLERATCAGPWRAEAATDWEVVSASGTLTAVARVPSWMHLLSVDGERVMAAFYDELEVPHLGVYRVFR